MRRGFDGLSAQVQHVLQKEPLSGQVFVFRGRRGDIVNLLWADGDGLCLFAKRLERGRFIWTKAESGALSLTRAQLSMLLEGIDWRRVERTWEPDRQHDCAAFFLRILNFMAYFRHVLRCLC